MTEKEEHAVETLVSEYRRRLIANLELVKIQISQTNDDEIRFAQYADYIADYFCVKVDKMLSKYTRETAYKNARQILYWLCKTGDSRLKWSLDKIGNRSGGFHHSTVLHGVKCVNNMDYDPALKLDVMAIAEGLGFHVTVERNIYTTVSATRQTENEQVLKLA